jgi:hypothetical protein
METVMRFVALLRPIALAAFIASLANADLRAADADLNGIHVPPPSGPNAIGTFSIRLTDVARSNPFLKDGSRRELMVRLWYPAVRTSSCANAEPFGNAVSFRISGIPALMCDK